MLSKYGAYRDEQSIENSLVLKGERVIIPESQGDDIIEKINLAHHAITTCQLCPVHSNIEARARKCYNQHNIHSNGCIERQLQSVKNILDKAVKSQWTGPSQVNALSWIYSN